MLLKWTNLEHHDIKESNGKSSGTWKLLEKYFIQSTSRICSVDYHIDSGLLAACFSNGSFELYRMPTLDKIYKLSITRAQISTVKFNSSAEWLAFGCAELKQLLVWDLLRKNYKIKQQGHTDIVSSVAYSPDGVTLATGSYDCKVKVWSSDSGKCFITFTDHTMPVTAVVFLPPLGKILISSSIDGTIKAFDLIKLKNIRTFLSPVSSKLTCMAVDITGDVVCASSEDNYKIFIWNARTAQLIGSMLGHKAPVASLAFGRKRGLLASGSWDTTVRLWEIYKTKEHVQSLHHDCDVIAIAFRTDCLQLASSTIDGQINIWDIEKGELQGIIVGKVHLKRNENTTSFKSNNKRFTGQCFESLVYSVDGAYLLAGGGGGCICVYNPEERILITKLEIREQITFDNLSINNTHHSKKAKWKYSNEISNQTNTSLVDTIAISTTGKCLSVTKNNDVLVFNLEPIKSLEQHDMEDISLSVFSNLISLLTKMVISSPHIEFILRWIHWVITKYTSHLELLSSYHTLLKTRSLRKVLAKLQSEMYNICNRNIFKLHYLKSKIISD
jgi:periodic tryptophan protein 2